MLPRPALLGHRGARALYPENTLEGFIRAIALGVDALELDVGMTADGVVVVSHDPALNPAITRTARGDWLTGPGPRIRTMTLEEVQRFDVGRIRPGTEMAAQFPDQQAVDGARIPTLAEVLRLHPRVRFTIEVKTFPPHPDWTMPATVLAEAVAAVAAAEGVIERITVQSFDWRVQRHLRRVRPEIALAWLTEPETVADAELWWDGASPEAACGSIPRVIAAERAGGEPIDTWAPDVESLTPALVDVAHALGLRVVPWTVNDEEIMRRLLDWGVDGLITDRPDRALAVRDGR